MGDNHGKVMSIKVEGLDKLVNDLKKFGNDGERIVKTELNVSGSTIERNAINRAPAMLGGQMLNIKQRIDKTVENQGFTVKVGVQGQQDLDAYIEFGTGLDAAQLLNRPNYTDEIRDLALTFFKTGDGTLRNRSYLFPSFFEESPKLIQNLKRELENLANKS